MYVNRKFYQIQEDSFPALMCNLYCLLGQICRFLWEGVVLQIADGWTDQLENFHQLTEVPKSVTYQQYLGIHHFISQERNRRCHLKASFPSLTVKSFPGGTPFQKRRVLRWPHLEQCYQVRPWTKQELWSDCRNTEPEHQPYLGKPLALTWTQLVTNQYIWSSEPHCLWSRCTGRTRSRCSLSLASWQSWRSMATSELWQCPRAWGFEGFEDVFTGSQSEAQ